MLNIERIGTIRKLIQPAIVAQAKVSQHRADKLAVDRKLMAGAAAKVVNAILDGRVRIREASLFEGHCLSSLDNLPKEIVSIEGEDFYVFKPYMGQMVRTNNGPVIFAGDCGFVDPSRVYIANNDGSLRLGFPVGEINGVFTTAYDTDLGEIVVFIQE